EVQQRGALEAVQRVLRALAGEEVADAGVTANDATILLIFTVRVTRRFGGADLTPHLAAAMEGFMVDADRRRDQMFVPTAAVCAAIHESNFHLAVSSALLLGMDEDTALRVCFVCELPFFWLDTLRDWEKDASSDFLSFTAEDIPGER